jgi:hypothetical protein
MLTIYVALAIACDAAGKCLGIAEVDPSQWHSSRASCEKYVAEQVAAVPKNLKVKAKCVELEVPASLKEM